MKKGLCAVLAFFIVFSGGYVYAEKPMLEIEAKAVVLMESGTGKVLYEENPDERLPIASVTKIMTMLLIMEAIDDKVITLEDMVPVSERAMSMGGSTMFLEAGESLSVHDMLKGIAVASANDGCVAMGEYLAGSVENFVSQMNKRAKELGMENTNFVNTNGLDADEHYSSAKDVAKMSRELLKHELIFDYTTIWTDELRDGKFELANTNKLVRFYDGATGLKTGSTSKAQCCISATAKRNDMHLIAVVLGAPDSNKRFSGARTLLDYGFSAYEVKKITSKGEKYEKVKVSKGVKSELKTAVKSEISVLTKKGDQTEAEIKVKMNDNIKAPVRKGDTVGKITAMMGGIKAGESDIVATQNIEKKTYFMFLKQCLGYLVGI